MTDNNLIPDVSEDDFANDKEIQKTRAEAKAYEEMVESSLSAIQHEFNLQDASHISFEDFHMFKSLTATITHSMKSNIQNKGVHVSLAEYFSAFPIAKSSNSGTDQYLFGHFTIRNSYPRTYIHKETIKDKIEDIFLKQDVDFDHSIKFSRKFQVLTEDRNRLQILLQFKSLDSLTEFPEMEVEFFNNSFLFRHSRRPISLEEASLFCNMTRALLVLFD